MINFLTSEFQQRVMLGTCILLVALIALTLSYSCQQWYDDWSFIKQTPAAPSLALINEDIEMINAIPDRHLFGNTLDNNNVPITHLQLQVTGIVKVDDNQPGVISKAYISTSGQPSKIYQVGERLPSGVKVYEITPDAVILENDGRIEKLPLPREKLQFKKRADDIN